MLSLIVPVYKNEDSIPSLLEAVSNMSAYLDGDFEAVFVVDGSPDLSYKRLKDLLPTYTFKSQLLLLSRNFGSFPAIRAGMIAAKGLFFAVMAADLQEPPSLVLDMHKILLADQADVTIGVRESRSDPLLTKLPSKLFWSLYRKYVVPDIPEGGVDMFGCNKAFRDELLKLDERHSSLIAQVFWLGFRRVSVPYVRQAREHGSSAWTFKKKLNYMMDSIFAFTDLPIRLLIRVGASITLLSILFGVIVGLTRMAGIITVSGYAMTINIIILLGAANLLGLGIVGSYAWRTYENTKARPIAIPMRTEEFNK